ncbi:PspC domain-containing protein [Auraticoccus monumenti]|uniref:Phage shock protein PspC (Stress-responsive transcriptional regulator) n=1 Tax=Auraticoccus monumenti TaxID=675864 RepID=A0A1G6XLJ8_9ACTN|nr:PspC domain-containing protein [Auraticoccus monumenti]SDD78891.1 Phage shock protein PspC (stress-responsive transcriptional regulator) [Auraticoccus monumenti]
MDEFWTLRRSGDRKIAGVCGALAAKWQVDPLVVRIGAVLLGLSAGVGVALYVFAWALWRDEREEQSPVERHAPGLARQSREFWVVTMVVSCIVVAVTVGSFAPLGLAPAAVVLAVWYFGHRRPQQQARRTESASLPTGNPTHHDPFAGPETPFTTAAREWQQTVLRYQQLQQPTGAPGPDGPRATAPTTRGSSDAGPVRPRPVVDGTSRYPSAPTGPVPPEPRDPEPEARRPGSPWPTWNDRPAASASMRWPEPPSAPAATDVPAAPPRPEALSDHTASVRSYLNVPDPAGIYVPEPAATAAFVSPRRRSRAVLVGFLVTLVLALTGVAVVDQVTGVPVSLTTYLGTALMVSALSLVAGAFRGRFRGQVLLAWLLLLATAVAAVPATVARSVDWQQPQMVYTTLEELPASSSIDVGVLDIDLSRLDVTTDTTYRVSADAGQISLRLPADTAVEVRTQLDVGTVMVDGSQQGGTEIDQTHVFGPATGPRLVIDARVDAGSIELESVR